jgi:hypothetical protein
MKTGAFPQDRTEKHSNPAHHRGEGYRPIKDNYCRSIGRDTEIRGAQTKGASVERPQIVTYSIDDGVTI